MRAQKKLVLSLCGLASVAMFSTASISTTYYQATNVSTLVCQPGADVDQTSSSLMYTDRGLFNRSDNKTVSVSCPVITEGIDKEDTYTIHLVAKGASQDFAGRLSCTLAEVENINLIKRQSLSRAADIYGTTPKSLNWTDVKKMTVTGESAFTIKCNVPPRLRLANITVNRTSH